MLVDGFSVRLKFDGPVDWWPYSEKMFRGIKPTVTLKEA